MILRTFFIACLAWRLWLPSSRGEPSANPAATTAVSQHPGGGGLAQTAAPRVRLHLDLITDVLSTAVNPRDPAALFDVIFRQLPAQLDVRPSENYVYWQTSVDGYDIRGNFRIDPTAAAQGELLFAYSEWQEFPSDDRALRIKGQHEVKCLRPGSIAGGREWVAEHQGHRVTFRLQQLDQMSPPPFTLATHESFVQRTEDESGLPFILLFDSQARSFRWCLDAGRPVPEHWRDFSPTLRQGRRTGFVFKKTPPPASARHPDGKLAPLADRWTLCGVRQASVDRNDYFDGPFDQLAENDALSTRLLPWLLQWQPSLAGKIDAHGRYLAPETGRVAITPYRLYTSEAEARSCGTF